MDNIFLCWLDTNGNRGYLNQSTPHIVKKVGTTTYIEAPGVLVAVPVDANLFIMAKETDAIQWVKTGNNKPRLSETCQERGVV